MRTYYGPKNREAASRRDAEIDAARIEGPSDIPGLPWIGNYASDAYLFHRINLLERQLIAEGKLSELRDVVCLTSLHGMGETVTMSDQDLADYVASLADA